MNRSQDRGERAVNAGPHSPHTSCGTAQKHVTTLSLSLQHLLRAGQTLCVASAPRLMAPGGQTHGQRATHPWWLAGTSTVLGLEGTAMGTGMGAVLSLSR